MIDFHCHVDLFPDPRDVVERCETEGIYVLSVTTTPSAFRGTRALERGRVRTALGLHPQLAVQRRSELTLFDQLVPESRYVGEIGLDGAPEFKDQWEAQLAVFRHILASCASAGGRIMSIHSRRASRQVIDELERFPSAGIPVLHWFSGSFSDLYRAAELGCWFSVGPPMLRSKKGRSLVERMPRDRVLTESDGPFAQIGDRPAMPWDTLQAMSALADVWQVDLGEVRSTLAQNLRTLTSDPHRQQGAQ